MPNTTSAKKALRQSLTKKARNATHKRQVHNVVKEFRKAISTKAFDKAGELLPRVFKALDKAAKVNTIKSNKASRLKSRLSLTLSKSATKVATK